MESYVCKIIIARERAGVKYIKRYFHRQLHLIAIAMKIQMLVNRSSSC